MKKFLRNILWLLLPLALLAWPADRWLSSRLKHSFGMAQGEFSVWEDIYSAKMQNEVAVYGSSRAWCHYDPEILKDSLNAETYNLGMDGYGFYMQHMRHLEYFRYNKHPKYIILNLDLFTFEMPKGLYNATQFIPYMSHSENMRSYMRPLQGFTRFDYYVPLLRYYGRKSECISLISDAVQGKQSLPMRHKGYHAHASEWNEDFKNAAKLMEKYSIVIDSPVVQLMDRFLTDCARERIQVIMVYSPENIAIRDFLRNKQQLVDLYREIAQRHHLVFLDYSDDPLCYDRSNFYNASHLNARGSRLFSQKLGHYLKTNGFMPKNMAVTP